ncbi:aminopeptidase P family N-terminal domain-containing protein [Candidatus Poriferisodalis sp.]|uniref:aminopeptidase P family N-terminal domain-containing protein n=1 Tax=Candidatus Poriferisodalis sp. TaxID=3101277 RepID=UPI003D109914
MEHSGSQWRHRPKIGVARAEPPVWLLDHADLNMHALGPGAELEAEWLAAGLSLPDRPALRRYRLERVREQLRSADCDAALLYDPVNIRYATDTTNMSLREIAEGAWYPDPDEYRHYTSVSHGVGLCDEYPSVTFRHKWERVGYDGVLELGMVMCI